MKIGREHSGTEALELIAARKDGREICVELSLFSEIVADKLRIIGIFHDITERKNTLEALQRSETKYRKLFEETKDVVFISTPGGQFIDINNAGVELFGYRSKKEILKINISKDLYWDPIDRRDFKKEMERHGFVKSYEMNMKRKDGQKVVVSITANTVYDDIGKIATHQGIMRDLTEVKRLEGQLLEFQKLDALGRMIGDIAHNFNNILNIIVGNAQVVKMSGDCSGEALAHLSSIENEAFHVADIVEQLLVFGRHMQFSVNIVDMNEVVNDFVKTIHNIIGENIETRTIFASKPPRVKIDVARMNQVLLNLVLNAKEAMSGSGVLTIEVAASDFVVCDGTYPNAKPGKYVVLTVSDTGTGIDEETIKNIFEPFFTTYSSEEKKGLGLCVVYGIVKQHGGFVDVSSKPGQGTQFKVYLPLVSEWIKAEKAPSREVVGGSETILIAEDEAALRDITAHILKTLGYKVFSASDGVEAVALFKKNAQEIDIVVLDVAMPGMNGRETYREIQAIQAGIPVLFMTGYSLDSVQTNFIREEGFDVIQKPFTLASLGKKVREVLHKKEDSETTLQFPPVDS